MQTAFIGLGTMGAAMAGHLLAAGHDVRVHNRTREREEPLVAAGASRAATPREAATGAELVFCCVSDTPDVEAIVRGADGAAAGMHAGAILIDHSTIAPAATRALATELAAQGAGLVDAPVSGGSEGAKRGTLTAFIGGESADVERARPALETFCASITHLGPAGAGQAGKAANQVLISGTYASLGEALALAEREGLPLEPLVGALGGGAAGSWILQNRSQNVIRGEYPLGFRTSLHLKDLRIALAEADLLGLELAVTRLVAAQQERLIAAGYADEDSSALARAARGEL